MVNNIALFSSIIIIGFFLCTVIDVSGDNSHFHINFKENDILLPETKGDLNAPAQERYIEAEYTEILGVRTQKEDVLIGRFISESREMDMNFTFDLINIWFHFVQEPGQDADPHFQFDFYIDGAQRYGHGTGFGDPGHENIIEHVSDSDVTFNLPKESTLEVEVYYSGYEDIVVYLDNSSYDSGFQGRAESLFLFDLNAIENEITLEVYDIFRTDWNEVIPYMELKADNELIINQSGSVQKESHREIYDVVINTTVIKWTLDEDLTEGQEVKILVKYTLAEPDEEKGLLISRLAVDDDEDDGFIPGFELLLFIIAISISLIWKRRI